jgi:SAM-dependent methyltransferase
MGQMQASDVRSKWDQGVRSEVHFWRNWIAQRGGVWADDYVARLDPERPFSKFVESQFPFPEGQLVEILDVGAGPITCLGYASDRYKINITATDALANAYDAMLAQAELVPPVRTQKCRAEELEDYFGSRRFDVCHSRNALDHCIDPRGAILSMCRLLRPDGLLFIEVYRNEGQPNYEGLHNWNFDSDGDDFVLWRSGETYNITRDTAEFGAAKLHSQGRSLVFMVTRRNSQ